MAEHSGDFSCAQHYRRRDGDVPYSIFCYSGRYLLKKRQACMFLRMLCEYSCRVSRRYEEPHPLEQLPNFTLDRANDFAERLLGIHSDDPAAEESQSACGGDAPPDHRRIHRRLAVCGGLRTYLEL